MCTIAQGAQQGYCCSTNSYVITSHSVTHMHGRHGTFIRLPVVFMYVHLILISLDCLITARMGLDIKYEPRGGAITPMMTAALVSTSRSIHNVCKFNSLDNIRLVPSAIRYSGALELPGDFCHSKARPWPYEMTFQSPWLSSNVCSSGLLCAQTRSPFQVVGTRNRLNVLDFSLQRLKSALTCTQNASQSCGSHMQQWTTIPVSKQPMNLPH